MAFWTNTMFFLRPTFTAARNEMRTWLQWYTDEVYRLSFVRTWFAACVLHSRSAHQNRNTHFVRLNIFELLTGRSQRHLYSFRCIGGTHEDSNTKAILLVFLFVIWIMYRCWLLQSRSRQIHRISVGFNITNRTAFVALSFHLDLTEATTCDCTRLTMSMIRIGWRHFTSSVSVCPDANFGFIFSVFPRLIDLNQRIGGTYVSSYQIGRRQMQFIDKFHVHIECVRKHWFDFFPSRDLSHAPCTLHNS